VFSGGARFSYGVLRLNRRFLSGRSLGLRGARLLDLSIGRSLREAAAG
jgi:hypothetical protein